VKRENIQPKTTLARQRSRAKDSPAAQYFFRQGFAALMNERWPPGGGPDIHAVKKQLRRLKRR
jgi:hypothetical protein